ncbi:hypothetical protein P9112_008388 [Eukaryota sp. TZLM1-RC]
MVNIGRVLTRSTDIQDIRGISQQLRTFSISATFPVGRLADWVVATYVLESIEIIPIDDRLLRIWSSPYYYSCKGPTLGEFFSVLQIEYENFCHDRSNLEQLNHVDFTYQNQLTHQQATHRHPPVVHSPPDISRQRGSRPGKRSEQFKRGGGSPKPSSTQDDVQCNFCKHMGHPTANDEFHSWVAANDVEEHIIEKVLNQDGDLCQVQGPVKNITTEHMSTVQNTAAYKDFIKTSKARHRTKSAPPKKRPRTSASPPVTRAFRNRRSKIRKKQCWS